MQKEERQDGDHLTGLQHRLRHRVAHQAAHRFGFGGDHRHQLTLAGALKVGSGEALNAADELIAQTAQQAFSQHTLHGVDAHLHDAMAQNGEQEEPAQHHQEGDLIQLVAVEIHKIAARTNRVIDDAFGQFQRQIEQREERERHRQQDQLIAFGVFPNEGEKCAFYWTGPIWGSLKFIPAKP